MIKRDRGEIYGKGKIIPKSITIDNQKQKIETQEVISIGESISFDKKYKVYIDCVREDGTETKVPRWISNTMFRMAPAYGEPGGAGGAGLASSITGSEIFYAAGGAGASHSGASSTDAPQGGSSVGGNGAYTNASSSRVNATAGATNSGSGGGGGGQASAATGNGAAGVVILRYKFQ